MLKIALYTGLLKKTFCFLLNLFCIISWHAGTVLEKWAQKPQIKVRSCQWAWGFSYRKPQGWMHISTGHILTLQMKQDLHIPGFPPF